MVKKIMLMIVIIISLMVQVPPLTIHATEFEIQNPNNDFTYNLIGSYGDGISYTNNYVNNTFPVGYDVDYIQLYLPYSPDFTFMWQDLDGDDTIYFSNLILWGDNYNPLAAIQLADIYYAPNEVDPYDGEVTMPGGLSKPITVPKNTVSYSVFIYGPYSQDAEDNTALLNDDWYILWDDEYEPTRLDIDFSKLAGTYGDIYSKPVYIPNNVNQMIISLPGLSQLKYCTTSPSLCFYASINFYTNESELIHTESLYNNPNRVPLNSSQERVIDNQENFAGQYYFSLTDGSATQYASYFTLNMINRYGVTAPQLDELEKQAEVHYKLIHTIDYRFQDLDYYVTRHFYKFPARTYLNDETNIDGFQYWLYRYIANETVYKVPLDYNDVYTSDLTVFAYDAELGTGGDFVLPEETNLPGGLTQLLTGFDLFNSDGFIWIFFLLVLLINVTLLFFFKVHDILLLAINGVITAIFIFMNILPLYAIIILGSFFLISFLGVRGGATRVEV